MIDMLASIVANGTWYYDRGYAPWLPFDNFVPVMILLGFAVSGIIRLLTDCSITRAVLCGAIVLTSGFAAVPVVFVLWSKFDYSPLEVYGWWVINCCLIILGQVYLVWTNESTKQRIAEMEDRENAN